MNPSRVSSVLKNTVWELTYYLIVVILGFLAPRYIILIYGSAVNGLSATITQVLNVILLLQAGAATAAIYSLYKPIAEENINEVSAKLSSATAYFKKLSIIFLVLMTGAAIVTTFSIDSEIAPTLIFVAFIIMGFKSFLDLYFTSTYRILFTAYQEKFIMSIATLTEQVVYYLLVFTTLYFRWHFILLFFWLFLGCVVKIVFLSRWRKKKHPDIVSIKTSEETSSISGKNYALANEVAHSMMSTLAAIMISFMYGLKEASVYSIYMLVFSALYLILTAFNSSFGPSFGNLYASGDEKRSGEVFIVFRYLYLVINSILMMCTIFMLLPFITLYTAGVKDINYQNELLIILSVLSATFSAFRIPYNVVVSSLGYFKETWLQPVVTSIVCILISYFAGSYNYALIVLGPVVFYAVNFIYQHFRLKTLAPGLIDNGVFKILVVSIVGLALSYYLHKTVNWNVSIGSWIGMGALCLISSSLFMYIISIIFLRQDYMLSKAYFKNILNRRKTNE